MQEGECDLANFMLNRSEKYLLELIAKTWTTHNARKIVTELSVSRMDRLQNVQEQGTCANEDCIWLQCAFEVMQMICIDHPVCGEAVMNMVSRGRGKFRNLMLIRCSNTAKTFLLKPLTVIYKDNIFQNPSYEKFSWDGIDKAQVVLLQDFRYAKELIPWGNFLLLLEGEEANLPVPRNIDAHDIKISAHNDLPFFATGRSKIEFSRFSPSYEEETEMMDSRWNIIQFKHQFSKDDQIEMKPCPRCFVQLISGQ